MSGGDGYYHARCNATETELRGAGEFNISHVGKRYGYGLADVRNTAYHINPRTQIPYMVEAAPKVLSISPSRGSLAGGALITITGEMLGGQVEVEVGGTACELEGQSNTQIQCRISPRAPVQPCNTCLLYTSDAADEEDSVDLGGRRIIKKKKQIQKRKAEEMIK
eukprot:TRINITY_DN7662_c0_g1_i4.p1 TRINITY_DN7662_c0_g1~~TRINITY_DN7662_c0_g1_i4.p1  ORF type:complete len:165 (-),score=30.12 TRINITY_DN7662_c0_g1_i4:79-573(-)